MSTGSSAFVLAAPVRGKSSAKPFPRFLFGSVATAGLLVGCAWTVYANVFGANVFPALDSANFESPVLRNPPSFASRSPQSVINNVFAALPEARLAVSSRAATATPAGPSLSFDDRFAAAAPKTVESQVAAASMAEAAPKPQVETPKLAQATKPKDVPPPVQVAALPAAARPAEPRPAKSPASTIKDMTQRAKAAVMSIASNEKQSIVEKLWGAPRPRGPSLLSFASADASMTGSLGPSQNPALAGSTPRYDQSTAVYDISARTVYLPDGTKLEAHSGLGDKLDDPRSANIRMRGVTPPHMYELKPREALFHGVPALRLNPIGGEEAIYGRSGLLAHTYMLGPNGDSNGCVSFKDYNAFLNAYRNQGIKRLAVVARID